MRNKVILTVALMLVAGVGFAVARPVGQRLRAPRGPGHRIVAALDTDRDGQISAEELEAAATSLLTLDANGDGVLTPDEQGAPGARRGPQAFGPNDAGTVDCPGPMRHDTDGDGLVSLDEFLARAIERFQSIDANADGFFDEDEAMAAPPPPHRPRPDCPAFGAGARRGR